MKPTPWIVIVATPAGFIRECKRCNTRELTRLPLPLKDFATLGDAFVREHADCEDITNDNH